MKSAEEWQSELAGETSLESIQEIQLDAMKEGMRRAAEIAEKRNYFGNNNPQLGNATRDILTAAEQLTDKDL